MVHFRGGGGSCHVYGGLLLVVCTIATVVYTCMYSCFRVSSPIHTLHTAITHMIILLELWGVSPAKCDWNSREALQFQYFNHVSDCSVQCANGTRNPEETVYVRTYEVDVCNTMVILKVWVFAMAMLKRCVCADVLCNLNMTMLLLYIYTYVASVGLHEIPTV